MDTPQDAPPPYEQATAGGSSSAPPTNGPPQHKTRNGIPPASRRSMEDESRPLPPGWIRQYDPQNSHQFFVDTNVDPPRSIWHHPYDDQDYLRSLPPSERTRVQGLLKVPSHADIQAESSDDDASHGPHAHARPASAAAATPSTSQPSGGMSRFGRKMKDRITGTTHEQREKLRVERAEEERRIYARHQAIRQAMSRAMETGQPQLIGRDRDGKELYIEPPGQVAMPPGGYGYNPYTQGPYANPNATFVRPSYPGLYKNLNGF
ncbi:WW domain [Lasallia pustulata]|uniref:WW domain n=1 Tax=Lasallia pustulata TaxID=136370 RepID=A0A1W5D7A4_9LECA|nr:WW domain [Lasallia pustulata]